MQALLLFWRFFLWSCTLPMLIVQACAGSKRATSLLGWYVSSSSGHYVTSGHDLRQQGLSLNPLNHIQAP